MTLLAIATEDLEKSQSRKHLCIIPARLFSTRLPGKAQKLLKGVSLLERVATRCRESQLFYKIVVATDDLTVEKECSRLGVDFIRTAPSLGSGLERAAQALNSLAAEALATSDLIQNDWKTVTVVPVSLPTINTYLLESLINAIHTEVSMSTLVAPIVDLKELLDSSITKAVLDSSGRLLYVSKSPIPYALEGYPDEGSDSTPLGYRLIPVFSARPEVVIRLAGLPPSREETLEDIDILRAIFYSQEIRVLVSPANATFDVIEVLSSYDLERLESILK